MRCSAWASALRASAAACASAGTQPQLPGEIGAQRPLGPGTLFSRAPSQLLVGQHGGQPGDLGPRRLGLGPRRLELGLQRHDLGRRGAGSASLDRCSPGGGADGAGCGADGSGCGWADGAGCEGSG